MICLALVVVTAGVYSRVGGLGFVNFDDPDYIAKNPMVSGGLTLKNVSWAFTHCYSANWHPLTWISLMLDCQLFGLNPGASHWINVAWHIANTVLLFVLLQRLTGALWRSAAVAELFALHPLHVESIVWISERKDVLSTFFALLSLLAYTRYVDESRAQPAHNKTWFFMALGLFVLGLMAKPMLVTLPFVMLLLDYWPLQRIENSGWPAFFTPQFGRLVREKWAWFVLSVLSCVITLHAQRQVEATLQVLPMSSRMFNAIESYWWYVEKLFWPVKLAFLYPLHVDRAVMPFLGACLFIVGMSAAAVVTARRHPFLLTGWLWYFGTLIPVIGFVQVGAQGTADHYSYMPSIGLFIAIIWLAYEFVARSKPMLMLANAAFCVILVLLSAVTVIQTGYWRDDLSLFGHAVEVTRGNDTALINFGAALYDHGRYDEALAVYQQALQIRPAADIYKNIGSALVKKGKLEDALPNYERAAQLNPKAADIQYFWADTLKSLGRTNDAVAHYEESVKLEPDNAFYHHHLGTVLAAAGKTADALAEYTEAARLDPATAQYQNTLAGALARTGQPDAAIEHYETAVRDDPKSVEARSNLGALYTAKRRLEDAAREYSEALMLDPTNAVIHLNAGIVFLKLGRAADAYSQFAEAVHINPALAEAHYQWGHDLLLHGEFQAARDQLTETVRLEPDYAPAYFYLGLACMELHDFAAAIKAFADAERLRPDWPEPLNAHAWLLATSPDDKLRDGAEAVRLATHAVDITSGRQPALLNTLAAAYAETGQSNKAVTAASQAIELAQQLGQTNLIPRMQQALDLYHTGRPFRDTGSADK